MKTFYIFIFLDLVERFYGFLGREQYPTAENTLDNLLTVLPSSEILWYYNKNPFIKPL